jgi:rSAM/selenodomain-associated transferase 2
MKFSVIIPVLNEQACLPAAVKSVREGIPEAELIAVDGGSVDGSREWLAQRSGVRLIKSDCGKGVQQNTGAAHASSEVLIFLHADCQLPRDAGERLQEVLSTHSIAGGCFFVRFAELQPFSLKLLALAMNLRARILRRSFGDQALFIRREVFAKIGGFPDWPLFEDYELVRRLKKFGKFAVIQSPVTISARRFLKHGVWQTVLRVFVLQAGYYIGISPHKLKKWFEDVRPHLKRARPFSE